MGNGDADASGTPRYNMGHAQALPAEPVRDGMLVSGTPFTTRPDPPARAGGS